MPLLSASDTSEDTPERVELGRRLFFEKQLSRDGSIDCASCHDPRKGWSSGAPQAVGIGGALTPRNPPSLVNVRYHFDYFWDGRAPRLEQAVTAPIEHPDEMDLPLDEAAERLNASERYTAEFESAFGEPASPETIASALAAFVRSLVAGDAPVDRYRSGDLAALSEAARRGHDVFMFRANCQMCHRGPMFSDGDYHNLGVGMERDPPDKGRAAVTGDELYQLGAFRTPSLRDVARTAPYMHDGRFETLEEVVEFYEKGGFLNAFRMPMLNVVPLTEQEKSDLVAFLKEGLTSSNYPAIAAPADPLD
ncbi:cytochrome c peroxidase [Botrimarina sp.]|uniref:cytochrome-c peroxidase n=1 Tax=Botrimarina sp. TaxID=2795802 RepID=UPI0032ECFBBB